jgi:hypothetical protein
MVTLSPLSGLSPSLEERKIFVEVVDKGPVDTVERREGYGNQRALRAFSDAICEVVWRRSDSDKVRTNRGVETIARLVTVGFTG